MKTKNMTYPSHPCHPITKFKQKILLCPLLHTIITNKSKKELQDKDLKAFGDMLEETLSNDADISESDMKKYYDSFKDRLADKGEVEATVIANVNDKAIVEMEYSGLDSMDLSDKIRD